MFTSDPLVTLHEDGCLEVLEEFEQFKGFLTVLLTFGDFSIELDEVALFLVLVKITDALVLVSLIQRLRLS